MAQFAVGDLVYRAFPDIWSVPFTVSIDTSRTYRVTRLLEAGESDTTSGIECEGGLRLDGMTAVLATAHDQHHRRQL